MSYGIELIDVDGTTYFDSSSTTWNSVASFNAPANSSASLTVPDLGLSEYLVYRAAVNAPLGNQESIIHNVSRNERVFTATGGTVLTTILILGR